MSYVVNLVAGNKWRYCGALVLLVLSGCHLDDLLYPGPPPQPEKCFRTYYFRVIQQQDADTTYYAKSVQVPCEDVTDGS